MGGTRRAAGTRRDPPRLVPARLAWTVVALALLALPTAVWSQQARPAKREGPYDIMMFNTPRTVDAVAEARLFYASSPFGVAVTVDGIDRYDVRLKVHGLPAPSTLGPYDAYVAWAVTPDLSTWRPLGTVGNGTTVVGTTDLNKFLLVVTAEAGASPDTHHGPTVLHGTSPSGWLENFLTHDAFFRGVY
ncbi:MAG: hypothetical protein LJF04_14900 [Gemmatimonadetes bacterium]|nr:hypothetical protein [Gemmatimonadota bacterium]